MQAARILIGLVTVALAAGGCGLYGGGNTLTDLRRVANEDIASERYRALFLAGVEQAEWSLDMGDSETAGNILNGLTYLAYETRDEISDVGAVGTISTIHALYEAGTVRGEIAGRIIPLPHPDRACDTTTSHCWTVDTLSTCYELYSLPDTLHLGCISIWKP